jgi:hypothetical protein
VGDGSRARLHAFRSLPVNRVLLRVLAGYALFVLTEYAVWIAMLVFAYIQGGVAVAGLMAVAQLAPATLPGMDARDRFNAAVAGLMAGMAIGGGDAGVWQFAGVMKESGFSGVQPMNTTNRRRL